jgi:hypothetical protein
MGKPHKSFAKLAAFEAMEFESAEKRFKLGTTDDEPPRGFGVAIEDVFGDEPEEIFVHEGNVTHAGDVTIGAVGDYAGVYIIQGDLDVAGMLDFTQVDGGAVLLVTGSLRAKSISVAQEAQLWIGKDLEVADYVLAGVSDAGGLAVKGATTAKAIIVTDSEMVAFGKKPKARIIARSSGILDEDQYKKIEVAEEALAKPFDTEELEHEALVKAVRKGRTILA